MKTSAVLVLLGCVAVAGFVGWRVHAMNSEPVNHFAVLEDPSLSYTGGCESAVGSAEQVLRGPAVSPKSKLMLLVLGDSSTALEPRELGKYSIPMSRKVIEGRRASEHRKSELLADIWTKCNAVRPTSVSPIFLAVKESLAALYAEGCREGSNCQLRVNSDLEENVEPSVKNRLNNARGNRALPQALDNAGIDVTFCGYATTAGRMVDPTGREIRQVAGRDPARADRVQQTWRSMFTDPERVKFEPYCPKPSDPELYTATGLSRR